MATTARSPERGASLQFRRLGDPSSADIVVPPLGEGAVHVWLLPRADSQYRLRILLANYLALAADALRMERGVHGKPRLAGGALQFNMSNSGDHALLAVVRGVEVGVDLEREERRLTRVSTLIERCFLPTEAAAIVAQTDPRRALLRGWCAKEALVKAIGRGIAFGLQRVELSFDADGVPTLHAVDGDATGARQWQIRSLDPLPGYLAALAYAGAPREIEGFRAD